MTIIKIKIGKEYTKIKYSSRIFNSRKQAIIKAIEHLKNILEKFKGFPEDDKQKV